MIVIWLEKNTAKTSNEHILCYHGSGAVKQSLQKFFYHHKNSEWQFEHNTPSPFSITQKK
jgi:hypothetical protein